jgi:flagellar hook-associated protein 2
MASNISFGGLASGIDTSSIMDKLVELQSRPIATLQKLESGVKTQISALADITSSLSALDTAAKDLASNGVLAVRASGTPSSFSAAPGGSAAPGSFSLQVTALAKAAKQQSAGVAAGTTFSKQTVSFTVQGKPYAVDLDAGATVEGVAAALRGSGAPISATVLDTGSQKYLSITSLATGYPTDQQPAAALTLPGLATSAGTLSFTALQQASNAAFTVDGLPFTRTSNVVSDAISGTTLTLKQQGGPAEDLVLETDSDATKGKLQKFADAYNGVLKLVQRQLAVTKDTDRSATLAGNSAVRALQGRLQQLVSATVPGTGSVRSLADLGFKTSYTDGSVSIDAAVLGGAIARDPAAVNALFSTATAGIGAVASKLVQQYTRPGDGILTTAKTGLDASIKRMDADIVRKQAQVDSYRESLVRQFTAMEDAISKIKASGNFLTMQDSANNKK